MIILRGEEYIKGIITRTESKDFYVLNGETKKEIPCSLKGKFKLDYRLKKDKLITSDVVVVGDIVDYDDLADGTGVITAVNERRNFLSRKAPKIKGGGKRGERFEQVLSANIDCFYVVVSIDQPMFNNKTLDRFLISGESSNIHTSIIFNKSDLLLEDEFDFWLELYTSLGYDCYLTSKHQPKSLDRLKADLKNNISLFWGPSGVGKSSLLNLIYPHLELRTEEVSDFSNKGRHTTTGVYMHCTAPETYVIDTPGVREIEPYGIRKEDLAHYFREFTEFINDCKFSRCTHHHEPGCAVIEALENENITEERYDSYLRLLDTIEDDLFF